MFVFNHHIVFTYSPIRSVTEQKGVWRSNKLKYKLFAIYISKQELPFTYYHITTNALIISFII
jgi:hypothetical protein